MSKEYSYKLPLKFQKIIHKIRRANAHSKSLSKNARLLLSIFVDEFSKRRGRGFTVYPEQITEITGLRHTSTIIKMMRELIEICDITINAETTLKAKDKDDLSFVDFEINGIVDLKELIKNPEAFYKKIDVEDTSDILVSSGSGPTTNEAQSLLNLPRINNNIGKSNDLITKEKEGVILWN